MQDWMRFFRPVGRAALVAIGVAALVLATGPAQAAEEEAWRPGDAMFILDWNMDRDPDEDIDVAIAWARLFGERTWIGGTGSFIDVGGGEGYGVGLFYEYDLPSERRYNWFIGGRAEYVDGTLTDDVAFMAAELLGVKVQVGDTGTVRVAARAVQPINNVDGIGDEDGRSFGFIVGFSHGFDFGR